MPLVLRLVVGVYILGLIFLVLIILKDTRYSYSFKLLYHSIQCRLEPDQQKRTGHVDKLSEEPEVYILKFVSLLSLEVIQG